MDSITEFLDSKSVETKRYIKIIRDMLGSGRYRYAETTLVSILRSIEEKESISPGQIQAVGNIKLKPEKIYGYG